MFKESEQIIKDEVVTLIGPSVRVEGDVETAGDIVVEGVVSGNLGTRKNLKVAKGAKIFANVSAQNAWVAGEVQGNVKVKEKIELTSSAKIFGDLKTNTLVMAAGATLNGKCLMPESKKSEKPTSFRQEKMVLVEEKQEGRTKKS